MKSTETGNFRTRTDVWPFFTHQRDYNGNARLQIFAPLEPILPASKSIERNYSPLWSVWRAENNPADRRRQPVVALESLPARNLAHGQKMLAPVRAFPV